MALEQSFWTLQIICGQNQIPSIEEAFADESVALSILNDDHQDQVTLEVLYDHEPNKDILARRLNQIDAAGSSAFKIIPVRNRDWVKEVAGNLKPFPIARWHVFGATYRQKMKNEPLALQIDATSAFGTGEHPTTRGCLMMLDELLDQHKDMANWKMLDIGCGSGILAMAFAKATKGSALGVDMDKESLNIAKDNLRTNNLNYLIRFEESVGYANPIIEQEGPYDLIMANVFADPLCEMAGDLAHHLKPSGTAILSGFLNSQENAIISAHEEQGLCVFKRKEMDEWSVLVLSHPKSAS